jgi:hypothetical protein
MPLPSPSRAEPDRACYMNLEEPATQSIRRRRHASKGVPASPLSCLRQLLLDPRSCLHVGHVESGRVEEPAGVMFDDEPPHRAGVVVRPHRVDESDVARAFRFLEQHDVMA